MDNYSSEFCSKADNDNRQCIQCGKWFLRRSLHRHLQEGSCRPPATAPPPPGQQVPTVGEQLFHAFYNNELDDDDRVFFNVPYEEDSDVESETDSDLDDYMEDDDDDMEPDHEMEDSDDTSDGSDNNIDPDIVITFICQSILLIASLWYIPDTAVDQLLKLLSTVFFALENHTKTSGTLRYIASKIPTGLDLLRKLYGTQSVYRKYVACPKCKTLYKEEDCHIHLEGKLTPKECTFVEFPNSEEQTRCGELLGKVSRVAGTEKFSPFKVYLYQPLYNIIGRFLKRPGFEDKCEHWRTRSTKEGVFTDIYDGKIWKEFGDPTKHNFLNFPRHYGLILNVDWFQPFKDVKKSVGAIYLVLLNLPIEERYKLENVILVGLMPDFAKEPATNTFLRPLVDELQQAWQYGFYLLTHTSKLVPKLFKLAILCVGCDIPASRKVCGFVGHSAILGCNKCLKSFKGRDYSGFDCDSWEKRTNESHRHNVKRVLRAKTQAERDRRVKRYGVRYSVLLDLPYFDPIRMTPIDPMHNLLLGTPKRFREVWKRENILKQKHYAILQEKVDNFKSPADISGIHKKISSGFSRLTADQWKNWTLLYSMYALRAIFQKNSHHLKCWQTFALACRCLCSKVITESDITRGHALLLKFGKRFEELYGKKSLTPNIHLHCHLRESIADYGPIYSFWLFSFERYNGIFEEYSNNNHEIESQLFKRFTSDVNIRGLQEETHVKEFESFRKQMLARRQRRGTLLSQSKPLNTLDMVNLSSATCVILNQEWDLPWDIQDSVKTEKVYKFDVQERQNLEAMYRYLYGPVVDCATDFYIQPACLETNSIKFMGQILGSCTGRNQRSDVIGARWCDSMGHIVDGERERPGKVQRYILHKVEICGEEKLLVIAQVHWYEDADPYILRKIGDLRPVEVWSTLPVVPGPAMFVPIQRIKYKAIATEDSHRGRSAMFVCPRQRSLIYD